jgi:broad specificity phosphatase PhoE
MRIFLIRHGQKQSINSKDMVVRSHQPLTHLGISQVKKTGLYIKDKYPHLCHKDTIYSSPFVRTVQTAEILRNILAVKGIAIIESLIEYYAHCEGSLLDTEKHNRKTQALFNLDWKPPNCISVNKHLEPIYKFFSKLAQSQEDAVVVSHGAIIRSIAYQLKPELKPTIENIADSKINEAGITVLNAKNAKFSLEEFDIKTF